MVVFTLIARKSDALVLASHARSEDSKSKKLFNTCVDLVGSLKGKQGMGHTDLGQGNLA